MNVGILIDIKKDAYREQIRHAVELGFTCGQLVVWEMDFYTEERLCGLRQVLNETGFSVSALWCGWTGPVIFKHPYKYQMLGLVPDWMRCQRYADLRRGAEFAHALGVDTVVTHLGFLPDDPMDPKRIAIVQCLKELCGEMRERGQRFAVETGEEIPLTLSLVLQEVGLENIGVNFDPANLLSGGRANPCDAMELLGCRVFGMHAKDAVPAKFGEVGGHQVPIGEGRVDFRRLIEQLKEIGYTGDMVIEHEMPNRPDRDADLLAAKAYLEGLIGEVYA